MSVDPFEDNEHCTDMAALWADVMRRTSNYDHRVTDAKSSDGLGVESEK